MANNITKEGAEKIAGKLEAKIGWTRTLLLSTAGPLNPLDFAGSARPVEKPRPPGL